MVLPQSGPSTGSTGVLAVLSEPACSMPSSNDSKVPDAAHEAICKLCTDTHIHADAVDTCHELCQAMTLGPAPGELRLGNGNPECGSAP